MIDPRIHLDTDGYITPISYNHPVHVFDTLQGEMNDYLLAETPNNFVIWAYRVVQNGQISCFSGRYFSKYHATAKTHAFTEWEEMKLHHITNPNI